MCITRAAIFAGSATLFLAAVAASADLRLDPELARNPPRVQRATVRMLESPSPSANAVLGVQFRTAQRGAIVIRNGETLSLLRDDGEAPDALARDGVYSTLIRVNVEQYAREQRRRLRLAQRFTQVPVIDGRNVVGARSFTPSTIVRLQGGMNLDIDDFQGTPYPVDSARELVVRDVAVVEDKKRTYDACTGEGKRMGAWTFGRLITEMANQDESGVHPGDFAEHWFSEWLEDQTVNTFDVTNAADGAQRLLDQWPRLANGKLDVSRAPFRLLAIVNRLDLRESVLFSDAPTAGELRFVFGFLNCEGDPFLGEEDMAGTVILEYGVDRSSCFSIRSWARQWQDLGDLALGSKAYNAALQAITDQVVLRDLDPDQAPNRSAINQVRTNELAFLHDAWQFRESTLCTAGLCAGRLENSTVAQTPDRSFLFTETLRDFINEFEDEVLGGTHFVPLQYPPGSAFRGGFIHQDNNWDVPAPVDAAAVEAFSLATCNGCHERGEDFLHVGPRAAGSQAFISDFLQDDLVRRQMHLDATANMTCVFADDFALEELFVPNLPSAFVH